MTKETAEEKKRRQARERMRAMRQRRAQEEAQEPAKKAPKARLAPERVEIDIPAAPKPRPARKIHVSTTGRAATAKDPVLEINDDHTNADNPDTKRYSVLLQPRHWRWLETKAARFNMLPEAFIEKCVRVAMQTDPDKIAKANALTISGEPIDPAALQR